MIALYVHTGGRLGAKASGCAALMQTGSFYCIFYKFIQEGQGEKWTQDVRRVCVILFDRAAMFPYADIVLPARRFSESHT